MTPEKLSRLRNQLVDARAFLESQALRSNETRILTIMLVRLLEELVEAKASTELPARHHV